MVRVVLLDLGGVLFRFDHPHRRRVLADLLGWTPERVQGELWDSGFDAACDAGEYADAAEVRAEIRRRTGFAGPDDVLDDAWCSAFAPDRDVLAALLAAPPHLRLGVLTNNGPLEEAVLPRRHPAAFAPFRSRFFCHRLLANKPDPAVYRQVTALLDVPPEAIGFADDGAENAAAAADAGWRAVHYRAPADLRPLLTG